MAKIPITRLSGKIAAVTASTDGIGFAIARRLAQEGAKVVISSRKHENVDSAVSQLKSEGLDVTGLVCHVSNPDHRKNLWETTRKLGGLDILVSNAAVNPQPVPVFECEESAWDKVFDVNLKSSFLLSKEALPQLRERPYGRIIYISSIVGVRPQRTLGAYSISKVGLGALTKVAALQLATTNITVNCVAPGVIKTKFAGILMNTEEAKTKYLGKIPINRFGKPEEISGAVAFLASSDGSYITGETIPVAGGMTSRL